MSDYDVINHVDPMDDTDEDDLNDPHYGEASHYCRHGNYVGWWGGPDYMCGPCEDGISDADWAEICKANDEHREAEQGERMFWSALGAMSRAEHEASGAARGQGFDTDGSWTAFLGWIIDARKA